MNDYIKHEEKTANVMKGNVVRVSVRKQKKKHISVLKANIVK